MAATARPDEMSERELTDEIVAHARNAGWLVMHPRPAVGRGGRWQTALQGHVGFPDLTLVHRARRRIIFAELKRDSVKKLGPGQQEWLDALNAALSTDDRQGEAVVWRPRDLPHILATLYGRPLA